MTAGHRIVVCGTTFGRVHAAALTGPDAPAELAGILARGSDRSVAVAREHGVPLYRSVDELPDDVDAACVAVRAGVVGGAGTELALALLRRGVHVLAEHPVHRDELAECLRQARQAGVNYRLNDHYPQLDAVRRFAAAAHALYRHGPPLWVDAGCGIQVAYSLFGILGAALPSVRPWGFAEPPPWPASLARLAARPPLTTVHGVFGGVPLTLRVHNQLDPHDPDNHGQLLHRVTIGADAGNLTLLNTHGPVLWTPRLHFPANEELASCVPLGDPAGPPPRRIVRECWPLAMRRAIAAWLDGIDRGADPLRRGQYDLALCQAWHDLTALLGYPTMIEGSPPPTIHPDDLGGAA